MKARWVWFLYMRIWIKHCRLLTFYDKTRTPHLLYVLHVISKLKTTNARWRHVYQMLQGWSEASIQIHRCNGLHNTGLNYLVSSWTWLLVWVTPTESLVLIELTWWVGWNVCQCMYSLLYICVWPGFVCWSEWVDILHGRDLRNQCELDASPMCWITRKATMNKPWMWHKVRFKFVLCQTCFLIIMCWQW